MAFDLAAFARPATRAEMLASGALIDTTAAAAFLGFTAPAAMSAAAWDELVCGPVADLSPVDARKASDRLQAVWIRAQRAVLAYKASGTFAPIITFKCRAIGGRELRVALLCRNEAGRPGLTITLEGEL